MSATPPISCRIFPDYASSQEEDEERPIDFANFVRRDPVHDMELLRSTTPSPFPGLGEIEDSLSNEETSELSKSLVALRTLEWSPCELAEKLMENQTVKGHFKNADDLAKIIADLKRLDLHLQAVGFRDLEQFLASLIPPEEDDWVIVPRSERQICWFPKLKKVALRTYRYGKKLAELKGVIGALSTAVWLLTDPRTKMVIRALVRLII